MSPSNSSSSSSTAITESSPKDGPQEVVYKSWDLFVYEIWVLGVVNTWAWGCGTDKYLLPHFRANVGKKHHLDIGSGTAYYLRKGNIPASTRLTLLDLERPALELGLKRSGRADARGVLANILEPLPPPAGEGDRYDSVSMYYLLHCIPASVEDKCRIFSHVKHNMTADGVTHGATVLGKGVRRDNRFAAHVRRGVLRAGIFHNLDDNAYDFEHALRKNFEEVETWVVGSVFMWRAAKPKYRSD